MRIAYNRLVVYTGMKATGTTGLLPSKTKAQLQTELRSLKATRLSEGWVAVIQSAIRWGALILIARYCYLSVYALAGRVTLADIGISVFGKVEISIAIAWIIGIGGISYGLNQRRLRRNTVERLQRRIQELEKRHDKKRTSSRLTDRGETRPEDRI